MYSKILKSSLAFVVLVLSFTTERMQAQLYLEPNEILLAKQLGFNPLSLKTDFDKADVSRSGIHTAVVTDSTLEPMDRRAPEWMESITRLHFDDSGKEVRREWFRNDRMTHYAIFHYSASLKIDSIIGYDHLPWQEDSSALRFKLINTFHESGELMRISRYSIIIDTIGLSQYAVRTIESDTAFHWNYYSFPQLNKLAFLNYTNYTETSKVSDAVLYSFSQWKRGETEVVIAEYQVAEEIVEWDSLEIIASSRVVCKHEAFPGKAVMVKNSVPSRVPAHRSESSVFNSDSITRAVLRVDYENHLPVIVEFSVYKQNPTTGTTEIQPIRKRSISYY